MANITREQLDAYLDDALSGSEVAEVERELRNSDALKHQLRALMLERDRGEHTVGAVWRRERLSCPSREQLGSYLLEVLDEDIRNYFEFHLKTIGCAFCLANLADLQTLQQEQQPTIEARRRRIFQSSAGLLMPRSDG